MKCILKLNDYYLLWSTVSDSPVTWGLPLDEFKVYYECEYGNTGMDELPARLERVDRTGTSAFGQTADEVILKNRAGHKEAHLSRDELIDWYCVKRMMPQETETCQQRQ